MYPEVGIPFWKHEYDKHGTCASLGSDRIDTQEKYFMETLRLRSQIDITARLASSNIIPGREKRYRLQQFKNALSITPDEHSHGAVIPRVEPVLNCKHDKSRYQRHFIDSVIYCVSKESLRFVECPKNLQEMHENGTCSHGSEYEYPLIINSETMQQTHSNGNQECHRQYLTMWIWVLSVGLFFTTCTSVLFGFMFLKSRNVYSPIR